MNRKLMTMIATAGVLLTAVSPMSAHHSFSAEFDAKKEVTLVGRVAKMEWVNPHAWLYIDVEKDGKTERWAVEFGSPNVLFPRACASPSRDPLPKTVRCAPTLEALSSPMAASSTPEAAKAKTPSNPPFDC